MIQQCSRMIIGLLLYNRPQDGDDSTESRGAQVRSYVSQGSREIDTIQSRMPLDVPLTIPRKKKKRSSGQLKRSLDHALKYVARIHQYVYLRIGFNGLRPV